MGDLRAVASGLMLFDDLMNDLKKRIKRINNSKKIKINPIQLKMCITEYKGKSFRESAKKGNVLLRFLSWSFCYNKSHDIHIILFNSWFCGQISPILSSKQVI